MQGKLIVIEGLDGCGKGTQAAELERRLAAENRDVKLISFPDYSDDSSKLVQMYLNGEFGSTPDAVNAYAASSFFAVDRYASYMRYWRQAYENGSVIIANRYTTSNAPHQMSKLPREQWDAFLDWMFDYEYGLLGLPTPDIVIMLTMSAEVSQMLLRKRYSGDDDRRDIHERNAEYLDRCRECSLYAAHRHGWEIIECSAENAPLSVEKIANRIYNILKERIF